MNRFFWRVIVGRRFRAIDGVLCHRRHWLAPFVRIRLKKVNTPVEVIWSKGVEEDYLRQLEALR